ncbi:MAG: class I SAM-dependent methyltransferase [Candidatus Omnitrophica bacterium]|nr:class I SAM-dependent methyltransferase [Candidatus Omnitrophota bacterium]
MVLVNKIKNLTSEFYMKFSRFIPSADPPKSNLKKEAIIEKINKVPFWWHHIELGYGIVTPGHQGGIGNSSASQRILRRLDLPADFSGKSVLDIGAFDGYFSFEAEKRGAARVLAVDNFYRLEKEGKHLDSREMGFKTAKEILASNVEYKVMDVLDLSPAAVGEFDIVLFLGVFYHLKHPLLALERIASITKGMMICESHFENKYKGSPVATFYEKDNENNDPTNWWGANQECMEAMIRSVGFRTVKCVSKFRDRIVLHAFK